MDSIPIGMCHCGCNQPTPIAPRNIKCLGWFKGQPIRYIKGHHGRGISSNGREGRAVLWTKTLEERFWDKVERSYSFIKCWSWNGSTDGKGRGQIYVNGKPRKAPRVVWELTHGPIPQEMHVLHRCDNQACVRPSHLFLGTAAVNMQDMWDKGRARPRGRICQRRAS